MQLPVQHSRITHVFLHFVFDVQAIQKVRTGLPGFIYAAQILALGDPQLAGKLGKYKRDQAKAVAGDDADISGNNQR